jgi:outer membrane protein assembly factor BamB
MTNYHHVVVSTRKPLRLWPVITIATALAAVLIASFVVEMELPAGLFGGVVAALLILIWWLTFSRSRWQERLGALPLMAAAVVLVRFTAHQSIVGAAQLMMSYILGVMFACFALAAWAVVADRFSGKTRWMALVASLLLVGWLPVIAMRTEGVKGGTFVMHLRWTPTPEDLLLAQGPEQLKPLPPAPVVVPEPVKEVALRPEKAAAVPAAPVEVETRVAAPAPPIDDGPAEWPGFRGPNRDSVVRNVRINIDWSASPPVQMWRRPVGPGWSSFSVRGDLFYTQEQRGNEEIVACYRVSTGEPVWRHADPVRFYESNGGAGPRSTPTISRDRVYSMGATGILNALDARTGKKIWSHSTSTDTSREVPFWGISSSPLVVDDVVIVSVGGTLAGYDAATGEQRWTGPLHGGSYSSPHLVTIDGVSQVVILSSPGAVSVNPADGTLLWEYTYEGGAIIQPAVTEDGDILINAMSAMGGVGTKRLTIRHGANGWTPEERWTTNGMKPYFNDYVIHKGHAYGFDNNILACIDLADGKRKWKGGRYGNGQMLLLADQDLLLVTSEEGELALVSATTDQYKEIAKMPLFDEKTWNHPVVVGNVLLVRNGAEMAAFRLGAERPRASDER